MDYVSNNILQYGAKGDGKTNDVLAIQNTFNNNNHIYIPAGNYFINGTIIIPKNCTLEIDTNAKLFQSNISAPLIQMKFGSKLEGGQFYLPANSSSSAIQIDSVDCIYYVNVKDIRIFGTGNTGIGINLCGSTSSVIFASMFSNINIAHCNVGLSLTANNNTCINENVFDNLFIEDCTTCIKTDKNSNGNIFNNIQIQSSPKIKTIIDCDSLDNVFNNIMVFDLSSLSTVLHFGSNSTRCKFSIIDANINSLSQITDEGISNKIDIGSKYINPIMSPLNVSYYNDSAIGQASDPQFLGNQDDILAFSYYKYNITYTGTLYDGNIANMFEDTSTSAVFTNVDCSNAQITIDFGKNILLSYFGINFNLYYLATDFKVEFWNGTTWQLNINETNNRRTRYCTMISRGNNYSKVRITITKALNANNTNPNKRVYINRIYANSNDGNGGSLYMTHKGGAVYGDMTFKKDNGIVLQTPDGTKKYKIGIDDKGNIISTLIQ